jgi:hypothetical protein
LEWVLPWTIDYSLKKVLKIAAEVTFEDLFAKASLDGDPIIS